MGIWGEPSDIAWLYCLKRDLVQYTCLPLGSDSPSPLSPENSTTESEFLLQDIVDTLQVPPQLTAKRLVDSYFQVAHNSLPFIGKVFFLSQFQLFYSDPMARPGKRWMAVLNMVFAIASRHSSLIGGPSASAYHEHTVYFSRAWSLSMHNAALLEPPNLQQVQIEGLVSFYLLCIGQINRWVYIMIEHDSSNVECSQSLVDMLSCGPIGHGHGDPSSN